MKKALILLLALAFVGVYAFADDAAAADASPAADAASAAPIAPAAPAKAVAITGTLNTGLQLVNNSAGTTLQLFDLNEPTDTLAQVNIGVTAGDFGLNFELKHSSASPGVFIDVPAAWITANFFDKMITLRVGAIDAGLYGTANKGWISVGGTGIQASVSPMAGLSIGMFLEAPVVAGAVLPESITTVFSDIQLGASFSLPNIANFALVYINEVAGATSSGQMSIGVNVTAVAGLTLQVEFLMKNLGATASQYTEIFGNAWYAMGALGVGANVDYSTTNATGANVAIAINPGVSYTIGGGIAAGLGFTYTLNSVGASTWNANPWVTFANVPAGTLKLNIVYDSTSTLTVNFNWMYAF